MFAKLRTAFEIKKSTSLRAGPILKNSHIEFNLMASAKYLFHNFSILIISAIICTLAAGTILYFMPATYSSYASILPSGKGDNLSLLKEMAGLSGLGSENNENSSVLYPKILISRQLRMAVINYNYRLNDLSPENLTLKEYFGTTVNEHLLSRLDKITTIDLDNSTGLITISATTEYPQLSKSIVRRYLAELEDYNINRRKSSAAERVKYLKRESVDREVELKQAEDDMEAYQMANRNWNMTSDPGILSNLNRKKREILVKSETYLFLTNQYELAKLEAQKDIPIVRILDNPSLPLVKSGPSRLIIAILFGIIGMVFTAIYLLILTALRTAQEVQAKTEEIEMPMTNRQTTLLAEEIN